MKFRYGSTGYEETKSRAGGEIMIRTIFDKFTLFLRDIMSSTNLFLSDIIESLSPDIVRCPAFIF